MIYSRHYLSYTPLQVDEGLVAQLTSMGFSENGCRRAAIATGNADPETAMNWIFEHMEDADFNDPPVLPSNSSSGGGNGNGSASAGGKFLYILLWKQNTGWLCQETLNAYFYTSAVRLNQYKINFYILYSLYNLGSGAVAVDPEAVAMLTSMGYSETQVSAALMTTDNNIER